MSIDIGQCRTILDEFASRSSHDKALPVRLSPICRQLGVTSIRRAKLRSGSALLVDAGTRPKILVKAPDENLLTRTKAFTWWERFVIAHELGHLVLEKHKVPVPAGRAEYWKVEALCDDFAGRLLIPEHVTKDILRHDPHTPAQWLTLSNSLAYMAQVPWLTAGFRLAEMNKTIAFVRMEIREGSVLRVICSRSGNRGFRRTIKSDTNLYHFLKDLEPWGLASHIPIETLSGLESEMTMHAIVAGAGCLFGDEYRLAVFVENREPSFRA